MVKCLKPIKMLLNVFITTCQGKPYYRAINLLCARIWTTVMSSTISQLMMIIVNYCIRAKYDPVNTNYEFTNKIESA